VSKPLGQPMTLPFAVPASLFPVDHRWLDFDGARIHYIDEGTGDTLLLLHGNPSWSFLYRKIIARLKDDYRCVAPDYPGYGMSAAPAGYRYTPQEHSRFLEQFVDTLGLTRLTVMVQDWGGPIGFALAGRRPELIRAFVVGNTFAWPLDGDPRVALFSRVMGGFIGRSLTWAFNFVPRFFFRRGLARPVAPEVLRLYLAPWRPRSRRRAAVIAPKQLTAASEFLQEVERAVITRLATKPALIVWGTKDFAFGDQERRRFEQIFSTHRTILYDNASHFLQEDAGELIAEEMARFVAELS
jgi:haloalkane dehalogenase